MGISVSKMPKIGPLKKKIASQKLINSHFLDKSAVGREEGQSLAYMTLGQQRFNDRKRSSDMISIPQSSSATANESPRNQEPNSTTSDNPNNAYGQKGVCASDKSKLEHIQVLHSRNGSG